VAFVVYFQGMLADLIILLIGKDGVNFGDEFLP